MSDPKVPSLSAQDYPSPAYSWYVVVILTLAYVLSFLDRQILALLLEPIRDDLGLSDFQVSLLIGLAFAIFYTVMGIPLGRLADLKSRRAIIAAGITVWCLMTAACGLARNFGQLFLARVGVGVGEAALNPAAMSLISDYFPREKRGQAVSFYNMGVGLGAGIAMIAGGAVIGWVFTSPPMVLPVVGELYPWQTVFLVVGLPGLIVAALMATVREPERKDRLHVEGSSDDYITLKETASFLWTRRRTYGFHFLGMSVVTIVGYAYFSWIPTLFVRTWDWSIPQIGLVYGAVNLICGPLGVNLAGWMADRWYRAGQVDAHLRAVLVGAGITVPFAVIAPIMPGPWLSVGMIIPATIGAAMATATGISGLMMIVPNQLRAQSTALYYFTMNIFGLTIGPSAVAAFTDFVFQDEAALPWSLSIVCMIAGAFAALFLATNLKHYRLLAQEAESWSQHG